MLTSTPFGMLQYVPPAVGLLPFLAWAEGRASGRDHLPATDPASRQESLDRFWPCIEVPGCRGYGPDLQIRLTDLDGLKAIVLLEAKHRSGKSSAADEPEMANDQLAREWSNLRRLAAREGVWVSIMSEIDRAQWIEAN